MPKVKKGETASGIVKSLGVTSEDFLKSNPSFAGKGGKSDFQGLTGEIQVGQEYIIPSKTPAPNFNSIDNGPIYVPPPSTTVTPPVSPATPTISTTGGDPATGSTIIDPRKEEEDINNKAVADMMASLDIIQKELSGKVDLSKSTELVNKLLANLESDKTDPTKTTLEDKFLKEKERLGIDPLETELAQKESALKKLEAEFTSGQEDIEGKPIPIGNIRGQQSAREIAYNRARRDLVVERDFVANQLNQKYDVIKSIMTFAGKDYENAQQDYQLQFNKAIALTSLLQSVEDKEKTQQDKLQDNARANATIMFNLLKEGNVNYDSLDAGTKASIRLMEIQAGLPEGFTNYVSKTIKEPTVSFLSAYTDASGNRIQPVGTIDKQTGAFSIKNVNIGSVGEGSGDLTEAEFKRKAVKDMEEQIKSVVGNDGKISPNDWNKLRKAWIKKFPSAADEFDSAFDEYINKEHEDDYDTGL